MKPPPSLDAPTVVAIGLFVWVAVSLLHEGVGHGGACVVVGGQPAAISTTEFRCDNVAGWSYRVVVAAGSTLNLIAAALGLAALRMITPLAPTPLYFLWLFICTNLFHAGSYMLIGPFLSYGDWSHFVQGFQPELLWKLLVTALGYGICWLGMRVASLPLWQPLIGSEPEERRARMQWLTRLPFAAALVVSMLAALLSPLRDQGALFTAVLAPAVLLWLVNLPWWPRAAEPSPPVPINRSLPWLVIGVVSSVLFVGVFGPGIGSFSGYQGALP